jgi:glutamine cyclotransferase
MTIFKSTSTLSFLIVAVFVSLACFTSERHQEAAEGCQARRYEDNQAANVMFSVIRTICHDPEAFTQGLAHAEGVIYEGTGLYGQSSLRATDPRTGKTLKALDLPEDVFGEGVTILDDSIYQLTWKEGVAFIYDRETFELKEQLNYDGEGWGLATDGRHLIMSDGSSSITFREPRTFELVRSIGVKNSGIEVKGINELEYVRGTILANVLGSDSVLCINPDNGAVVAEIDFSRLFPREERMATGANILNGMAFDSDTGHLFVTGKRWPVLFEVARLPSRCTSWRTG